jgi:lipoprotein-anchoring transpeptidase ErfK/SrfK/LysM repeat protein
MKHFTMVVVAIFFVISAPGVHNVAFAAVRSDEKIDQEYVVQPGDTMLKIAARFGVNVTHLATANELRWNDWVYVGQSISVPGSATDHSTEQPAAGTDKLYDTDPRVPDPLPQLPVAHQEPIAGAVPFTYARVVLDTAPVYGSLDDAISRRSPKRILGPGYVWVSIEDRTNASGEDYYQINKDEFIHAAALKLYSPSEFRGIALAEQPERPFAWILKPVQPRLTPGGQLNPQANEYQRYDLVQIFAAEQTGEQVWYLIGPHQWINQVYVGKVTRSPIPAELHVDEPNVAWIEVNLFEQTLAAYEGDRMVYATLVSTGLRGWDTPPGLFEVWLRFQWRKMSGAYGRPDYYFLEDVPWTMYFNKDIALHTAYWHDGFGYRHSHGCVNLAPSDAKWLFDWAPETTWVWVRAGNESQQSAGGENYNDVQVAQAGHDS